MAIKQERMLALLAESQHLDHAHRGLITALRAELSLARHDASMSVPLLCDLLLLKLDTMRETPWRNHIREEEHFKLHRRRNERSKERETHKRLQSALPPSLRVSSPSSLSSDFSSAMLEAERLATQADDAQLRESPFSEAASEAAPQGDGLQLLRDAGVKLPLPSLPFSVPEE